MDTKKSYESPFMVGKFYVASKSKRVVKIVEIEKVAGFRVDNNGWFYNGFGWCFSKVEAETMGKKVTDFDLQREATFIERLLKRKLPFKR